MQIDFFLYSVGLVVIGVVLIKVLDKFLDSFLTDLEGRIRNRFKTEFRIDIGDCVHTDYHGLPLQSIALEITNNSKRTMRIDKITVYDKKGREMSFSSRMQLSPATEIEIPANYSMPLSLYFDRQPTGETTQVKLKMKIAIRGEKTQSRKFKSIWVSEGEFPTDRIMCFF